MTLNGIMAVTLRYFTEFGKPVFPSVCRLSVVCNVHAPYSGEWNF